MHQHQKNIFFSNLREKSEIGWIERKIKFQIFQIFIFRVMVIFVTSSPQFSMNFQDNLKNKNCKKKFSLFFILFSTIHISEKNLTISEGGGEGGRGLHTLGWDRADLRKLRIFCGKKKFCWFILVNFPSILSTKSTISQKLKTETCFHVRTFSQLRICPLHLVGAFLNEICRGHFNEI